MPFVSQTKQKDFLLYCKPHFEMQITRNLKNTFYRGNVKNTLAIAKAPAIYQ